MESINVSCLVNRSWDPVMKTEVGEQKDGVMIGIAQQSEQGKEIPVGIVVFEDNSFESVPMEFITKII